MKKGWEIKKLGEVCNFINGLWKGKKPPFLMAYVIRNTNFTKDGRLNEEKIAFLQVEKNQFLKRKLEFGDIILEKSGGGPKQPVGRVAIFLKKDGKYSFSNFTSSVRIKNKSILDFNFLHRFLLFEYLSGKTEVMQRQSTGIRNLQLKDYKDIPIPVPPLSEQERIVEILDKAFEAIDKAKANAEQNLKNAKELFDSYLNGIFENKGEDWEEKTLNEISYEFTRGKSKHRPRGDKSLLGGKYPFIQTGDISNSNHWLNNYSNTYNEKGLAQSKLWPKGTICIAIVGANVAETVILNFDACFPDSVIGIIVNPIKANNEYVEFLLQSFKTYLKEKGKGTARDNINMGTFKNQKFPFPSLQKQQNFVNSLNYLSAETKKLESIYQKKIEDLDELKKSILQKAFNGEL